MSQKNEIFLTESEKIDAIYAILKRQEKKQIFATAWSWFIKISIILTIFQLYIMLVTNTNSGGFSSLKKNFSKQMSDIVSPIVSNVLSSNPSLVPNGSTTPSIVGSEPIPTDLRPNLHTNQSTHQ